MVLLKLVFRAWYCLSVAAVSECLQIFNFVNKRMFCYCNEQCFPFDREKSYFLKFWKWFNLRWLIFEIDFEIMIFDNMYLIKDYLYLIIFFIIVLHAKIYVYHMKSLGKLEVSNWLIWSSFEWRRKPNYFHQFILLSLLT